MFQQFDHVRTLLFTREDLHSVGVQSDLDQIEPEAMDAVQRAQRVDLLRVGGDVLDRPVGVARLIDGVDQGGRGMKIDQGVQLLQTTERRTVDEGHQTEGREILQNIADAVKVMSSDDQRVSHLGGEIANENVTLAGMGEKLHQTGHFVGNVNHGEEDGHRHTHQHVVEIETPGGHRATPAVHRRNEGLPTRSLTGTDVSTRLGNGIEQGLTRWVLREKLRFVIAVRGVRRGLSVVDLRFPFVPVEKVEEELVENCTALELVDIAIAIAEPGDVLQRFLLQRGDLLLLQSIVEQMIQSALRFLFHRWLLLLVDLRDERLVLVIRRHFDRLLRQLDLELLDSFAVRCDLLGAHRQTDDAPRLFDARREAKEILMDFLQLVDEFVEGLAIHVNGQTFVPFAGHDRRPQVRQGANRVLLHVRANQIQPMFALDVDAFHRVDASLRLLLRRRTPRDVRGEKSREQRLVVQMVRVQGFAFDRRGTVLQRGAFLRFLSFRSRAFGNDLLTHVARARRALRRDHRHVLLQDDSVLHDLALGIQLHALQGDVFHVLRQRFDFRPGRVEGEMTDIGQVALGEADLFHFFQQLIVLKVIRTIDVQSKTIQVQLTRGFGERQGLWVFFVDDRLFLVFHFGFVVVRRFVLVAGRGQFFIVVFPSLGGFQAEESVRA